MANWSATFPVRPSFALSGITENQLRRTVCRICIRYGRKSTPMGSLSSSRLLPCLPGEGGWLMASGPVSMSPTLMPPPLDPRDTLRTASETDDDGGATLPRP